MGERSRRAHTDRSSSLWIIFGTSLRYPPLTIYVKVCTILEIWHVYNSVSAQIPVCILAPLIGVSGRLSIL